MTLMPVYMVPTEGDGGAQPGGAGTGHLQRLCVLMILPVSLT